MAEKKTNSFFKRLVGFLHFLFACVTLVGIGFMYLNSNYGRGLDWIKTETFEQSPDFSKKVQADITNIFDYVQIMFFALATSTAKETRVGGTSISFPLSSSKVPDILSLPPMDGSPKPSCAL